MLESRHVNSTFLRGFSTPPLLSVYDPRCLTKYHLAFFPGFSTTTFTLTRLHLGSVVIGMSNFDRFYSFMAELVDNRSLVFNISLGELFFFVSRFIDSEFLHTVFPFYLLTVAGLRLAAK